MFLRALFPSWKFFDDPGPVPRLFIRSGDEWWEWIPEYRRGLRELFLNGEGNLTLHHVSLLERLVNEVATGTFMENGVTYQLVERLARSLALKRGIDSSFDFKVAVRAPGDPFSLMDVLVSRVSV